MPNATVGPSVEPEKIIVTARPDDYEPNDEVREDPSPHYPVYSFRARWEQEDDDHPTEATSYSKMLRKPPGEEKLREELLGWYSYVEARDDRNQQPVSGGVELEAEFTHEETWVLSWFQHWTFDVGQTDQETLDSFQRFVDRHRWYHGWHVAAVLDESMKRRVRDRLGHDPLQLMGAHDRFRWGCKPDGGSIMGFGEERGDPPCRCEGCQERGVLTIDH